MFQTWGSNTENIYKDMYSYMFISNDEKIR